MTTIDFETPAKLLVSVAKSSPKSSDILMRYRELVAQKSVEKNIIQNLTQEDSEKSQRLVEQQQDDSSITQLSSNKKMTRSAVGRAILEEGDCSSVTSGKENKIPNEILKPKNRLQSSDVKSQQFVYNNQVVPNPKYLSKDGLNSTSRQASNKSMIKKKKKMIFNDRGKVEGRKTSIKSIIQTNNDSKLLATPKSFQKRSNRNIPSSNMTPSFSAKNRNVESPWALVGGDLDLDTTGNRCSGDFSVSKSDKDMLSALQVSFVSISTASHSISNESKDPSICKLNSPYVDEMVGITQDKRCIPSGDNGEETNNPFSPFSLDTFSIEGRSYSLDIKSPLKSMISDTTPKAGTPGITSHCKPGTIGNADRTIVPSIISTTAFSSDISFSSTQVTEVNSSRVISPSHSPQSTKHSTHSTSENIVELDIHVSLKKIKELEKALETVEFEREVEREKRMKYESLISVLVEHQKIDSHENGLSFTSCLPKGFNSVSSGVATSLVERNKTLVKEVRFADQTCVELSERNSSMQADIMRLEEEKSKLMEDNSSLHDAVVRSAQYGAKMEEDRDVAVLQLSEQQSRNQLQINNLQEKVFDSQSKVDNLKESFDRVIDEKCALKIELASMSTRFDTVEVVHSESKEKVSTLVEHLILTNSTPEQSNNSEVEKYKTYCHSMQLRLNKLQSLIDDRLNELAAKRKELSTVKNECDDWKIKFLDLEKIVKEGFIQPKELATPPKKGQMSCNHTPICNVLAKTLKSEVERGHCASERILEAEKNMITFNSQLVFVSNELESYKLKARDLVGQLKNVKTAISKVQDPTLVALLYQNGMPEIHLMDLNFLDVPNFTEFMIREEISPLYENTDEKVTDLKKPLIGQQLNHFNICNLSQQPDNVLKSVTQTPRSCDPIKSPEDSWRTDESSISTRKYSVEGMKAIECSFISVEDAHQEILRLNKTISDLLNQNSQQEIFPQKDEINEHLILDLQSQVATFQDMVSNLENDTEEKEEEIHLLNDKILEMEIINGRNEVQINDKRTSATNLKKNLSCILQDDKKLNKEHIDLGKQKIEGDKILKDYNSIIFNLKAKEDSIKLLKNLQNENESDLESAKREIVDKEMIIENGKTRVTEIAAKNINLKQKCIHLRDFIENFWDENYRKLQLLCKSHEQDAKQSMRKLSDLKLQQMSILKENKHLVRKFEDLVKKF